MKRLGILLGLLFPVAAMAEEEFHLFTNTKGQKLEAAVVGLREGQVTIRRRSDDKEFTLPLSQFIAADQKYVNSRIQQIPDLVKAQTFEIAKGVKMQFVWCPPGTFLMGNPESKKDGGDDEIAHKVTLTRGFWIGKYEVTQAQWEAVMGSNPSEFKNPENPVEKVCCRDAMEFCKELSARKEGLTYRLPTESEWEYACRAGSTRAFSFGNDETQINDYAWFEKNSGGKTHPVGKKKPNAWGLFDMHGNVWEWCLDFYGNYPDGPVTDPTGFPSGTSRVNRGGSWNISADLCRSPKRAMDNTNSWINTLGFRVAAEESQDEPEKK